MRRGRFSQAQSEYFLTICTADKGGDLTASALAQAVLNEAKVMSSDGTWKLHCAVLMPDHVHLLIALGDRLPLGKTVQRLKAKTAAALRSDGLQWERGFFDRKLRPDDDRLHLFLYIYLNPYRANHCARTKCWPWFYCREEDWAWFQAYLDQDLPPPEWIVS